MLNRESALIYYATCNRSKFKEITKSENDIKTGLPYFVNVVLSHIFGVKLESSHRVNTSAMDYVLFCIVKL